MLASSQIFRVHRMRHAGAAGEWGAVFGDAAVATTALDRPLHHSDAMTIWGDGYPHSFRKTGGARTSIQLNKPKALNAAQTF